MSGKIGLFLLSDSNEGTDGLRALLQEALGMLRDAVGNGGGGGGENAAGHIQTVVTDDGRIVIPEGTTPPALSRAILQYWPREIAGDAARVSYHESSWKSDATNDTRHLAGGLCGQRYWLPAINGWASTEYSVGYFQINICSHGGDAEHWYDADNNVRKAYELYSARGNWGDWVITGTKLGLDVGG